MTFGREKRLLLALLAALAAVPLPLNQALEWPYLLSYLGGIAFFLRRVQQDRGEWLPPWTMNLLGVAYLPFFLFDLFVLNRGRLVTPVVHLALFTVLVKLFSLKRERDKWQALIGIFFLFLAAMATSVHPGIVVYLALFVALSLLLLARFASLHLLAGFGRRDAACAVVPMRGFLTVAVAFALVLAVPLFALLPRVSNPYLPGRGIGTGPFAETTGFSDGVTLDSIGRIRTSREVALRIRYERVSQDLEALGDAMRFKGATFERYEGSRWQRSERLDILPPPSRVRMLKLAALPAVRWATLWLKPLSSKSLLLPVEAVEIEAPATPVEIDAGGALSLPAPPSEVLEYRVGMAAGTVSLAPSPPADAGPRGALDPAGISLRMAELAAAVMGEGTAEERARRLERHLRTEYGYTLDFIGRSAAADPLEEFLFVYKSGHCEYFASAMVLLLRSQGIPARLVTGFLGAEYNPLEDYFIVRHSNAHAWVEAYLPELGQWQTYDPTPAAGRPGVARASLWSLTLQAWDSVLFGWDRYVLGYGFEDQLSVFARLRRAWRGFWRPDDGSPAGGAEAAVTAGLAAGARERLASAGALLAAVAILALAAAGLWLARRRRQPSAVTAYRRLRRHLARAGVGRSAAEPPLALRRVAEQRWPAAAVALGRIFDLYLEESFGGRRLDEPQRGELATALAEALRTVGKTT